MWPTIDRARRRIRGTRLSAGRTSPSGDRSLENVVITLGAVELDRLQAALRLVLGDAFERADTPARIERALGLLLTHRGAPGRPSVLRRPAGVSTPEAWEIHLDGVDHATGAAIREASRSGTFA
jgi:hypothetical protein